MKSIPRCCFLLLLAAFVTLELCALALSWYCAREQVQRELVSDTYLAGSALLAPEDALSWSPISGATPEQYAAGNAALERYGYDVHMNPTLHPDFYRLLWRFAALGCGPVLVAFVVFAFIMQLFMLRTEWRIDRMTRAVAVDGEPAARYGISALDRLALALHEQYARRASSGERAIKDRRYMKDLLADMSHQLKTPLASMRMYVELMQRTPNMDDAMRERFLGEAMSQLERMEWLVQGLLKMARLEAGTVKLEMRPACIDDTLELAAAPFRLSARLSGTQLNVTGCGAVFPHDADWLAEAIGNLIKNALEHASGGHVDVRAVATPLTVEISVHDDGEGVALDVLPHMFERFYSHHSSVKSGSVGLGLALAKEIVTQSGGTISVESEPGQGTSFNIVFLLNR